MNINIKTGTQLKHLLGLDRLKYIKICRVLSLSAYKTYLVFFDSRYPNIPLTIPRILRAPMPSMIYTYPFKKRPTMAPPFDIEDFNGQLETGLFFVIDIAGYLGDPGIRTKVIENTIKESQNIFVYARSLKQLQEGLTIPDLKKNSISSLNKKFLKLRRSEGESGSTLMGARRDKESDSVFLVYSIAPTYDKEVLNYSSDGAAYMDSKYIAEIEFLNASNYIGDQDTFKSFKPSEQGKLVLDMIDKAEIKLWSSDPSFIYQGAMETLDDLDTSIYPLWSKKGHGIWNQRHGSEFHLTKHLLEILNQIKFLYTDIAKALREG